MQIPSVEIAKLLSSLEETPSRLAAMTNGRESSFLHGKVGEDEWSVNEILAHLRVCAEVWGKSILAMIAQDHPTLRYVSPRTVAKKRNYATQDYQASCQEFAKQRSELLDAVKAVASADWVRGATFTGTTKGRAQTIYSYIQRIADHESEHLKQIETILQTTRSQKRGETMDYHAIIRSQYLATLAMLQQAIEKCPEALWNQADDKAKFWHIAYHALFYTHLYLNTTGAEFKPWAKHREDYQFMGSIPWDNNRLPKIGAPYQQAELLDYIAFCRQQIDHHVPTLDLTAPSGFDWLPMSKFELQIYTIRHLQQHTGELMERLGSRADISVDWIGMGTKAG